MKKSFLWIAVILTCSCNPLKKAQDQFKLHPEEFASLSAKYFPCIPNHIVDTTIHIDDTAYKRTVNELLDYLQGQSDQLQESVDLLQLDSMNRTMLIQKQQEAIASLQNKVNNIKPVIKEIPKPYPVLDSARMQLYENILTGKDKIISDLSATNKDLIAQRDRQKNLKVKYMWWTGGLVLFIILYLAIGYYLGKVKKVNKII